VEVVLLVEELYIRQAERVGAMACAGSIFAWLEQEVKSNGDHVSSGMDRVGAGTGDIGNVD